MLKARKAMKGGEVQQEEFNVSFPFEFEGDLIFISVVISGETYKFLLDSGAPNVISPDVAKKINAKKISRMNNRDSQGNSSVEDIVTIDNILIEDINFFNTAAVVIPFDNTPYLACMKIDGIIGANLMKKAIWKIDYKSQVITITSSMDSLALPINHIDIDFSPTLVGLPYIDIAVEDTRVKNILLDLGSNGFLDFKTDKIEDILENDQSLSKIGIYGNASSGIYGSGKVDTSHIVKLPKIVLGKSMLLKNQTSFYSVNGSSVIGNKFFKNYDVIFNWFSKEMIFVPQIEPQESFLSTIGFSIGYSENSIYVKSLIENSSALKEGLKLGDRIVEIDGVNYELMNEEQYCKIVEHSPVHDKEEIDISVNRNGKILTFRLQKEKLL